MTEKRSAVRTRAGRMEVLAALPSSPRPYDPHAISEADMRVLAAAALGRRPGEL